MRTFYMLKFIPEKYKLGKREKEIKIDSYKSKERCLDIIKSRSLHLRLLKQQIKLFSVKVSKSSYISLNGSFIFNNFSLYSYHHFYLFPCSNLALSNQIKTSPINFYVCYHYKDTNI